MSSTGKFAHQVPDALPASLFYMSPEQVRDEAMDSRSNLFSLGAMFYEMVTERKAFDREDVESLRQSILGSTPVAPIQVNPKVHPLLSALIMKALAKDPAERYQTGRELLDDLEKCKETKSTAAASKKAEPAKGTVANSQVKAAAQSKFVGQTKPAAPAAPATPVRPAAMARPAATSPAPAQPRKPAEVSVPRAADHLEAAPVVPKAAAAAASAGSYAPSSSAEPELDLSDSFAPNVETTQPPSATMSSAVIEEPQVETLEPQVAEEEGPKIAVDPMMAEGGPSTGGGTSFSEISELPPLKEVYIAPASPPAPAEEAEPAPAKPTVTKFQGTIKREEKPKVQTREVAEKAIKEIKNVPPKLMGYALGAAGVVILLIAIGVTLYIHSLNSDDDIGTDQSANTPTQAAPSQPAAQPAPAPVQAAPAPAAQPEEIPQPEAAPVARERSRGSRRRAASAAPAIVPGQMLVDSTPQGAQVTVDGRTDPSYVTPFVLSNLAPGQHSVTTSKTGFGSESRMVNVTSGTRASVMVRLSQAMATLVVNSNPPGANIYIDGHDTGTKTPGQVSVNKGQHVVLVRKMGYIDETMNQQFVLGQTFNFAPTLRPLGNVDDMRTVGKMSRLFGGKAQAGQGIVSIRTQPKGAQVAINEHVMDKNSPLDVALDPGNYVIDISMSGYAPVHKVISVDKGDKVTVDENLQPQ
jgi:hypothetical protein